MKAALIILTALHIISVICWSIVLYCRYSGVCS